jgi:hypothetical protein
MIGIRTSIVAALTLIGVVALPASAAALSRPAECTHTLAQYNEAIRSFTLEATKAEAMAVQNPLYESDLAYYRSVLATAQQCAKTVTPVTTAAR